MVVKDLVPRHSLYLSNLDTKIKTSELKDLLYALFCQYGLISNIYASKKSSMRGQAFITFCKISDSAKAKRALNGAMFCGKSLKVDFTKNDAKIVTKYKNLYESKEAPKALNINAQNLTKTSATLFVSNLPENILPQTLHALFSPYRGFKEIRQIPGNARIAFAEYSSDSEAAMVKETLQAFKIAEGHAIKIEFSKK